MAHNRQKMKGRREQGSFVQLPHEVLNHPNYCHLKPRAVKLLFDLFAQYKGSNNGDLCAAWSIMSKRGWKSKQQLREALRELQDKGWVTLTRQGGRNMSNLYAVTFRAIDECGGKLDVAPTHAAPGDWKQCGPSRIKNCAPNTGQVDPLCGAMADDAA